MLIDPSERGGRTRLFYGGTALLFLGIGGYLVLALRPLFLPVLVGLFSAYLCLPLMDRLGRIGFSRYTSLALLLSGFLLVMVGALRMLPLAIPDEDERLELRVVTLYNIHERYEGVMGLSHGGAGNLLHAVFGAELAPLVEEAERMIRLSPEEGRRLEEVIAEGRLRNRRTAAFHDRLEERIAHGVPAGAESRGPEFGIGTAGPPVVRTSGEAALIPRVLRALSLWLIMPFIFVFTLLDNGRMRKSLVEVVPNAYFEMALTTLERIDRAIGRYLRGTVIECALVGISLFLLLGAFGFGLTPALLLGLVAGVANAIPLLGPIIGLVAVLGYAFVLEEPGAIIPLIHSGNILIWAIIAVGFVQLLDNSIFKPFVLGKAVDLHPVIVVFAAIGGAAVGGFLGMLLAIPALVILKVLISTVRSQLREYFFIY